MCWSFTRSWLIISGGESIIFLEDYSHHATNTTVVVIEVESEEARDGDEERVIAVEEVIVLDERTRGVGEEEVWVKDRTRQDKKEGG